MNLLQLKPLHFASVSGGKDSLYMLAHILHNLDLYPLDGVVHYELEMMKMCKESEIKYNTSIFQANKKYNTDYIENRVNNYYVPKLLDQLKKEGEKYDVD